MSGRGWWWHPRPWHGGGGGWHPRPLWTSAPGKAWNAPHPPASATHGTVAVAGSHLRVGPIGETHATVAGRELAVGNHASNAAARNLGRSSATSNLAGNPARETASSSRTNSPIVGRKGSYALAANAASQRNGYEVHRPPAAIDSRPEERASGVAPRSYAYGSSPAPRNYSVPPVTFQHAPSSASPSSMSHVSMGSTSGGFHGGGGGSHGGGGGHR